MNQSLLDLSKRLFAEIRRALKPSDTHMALGYPYWIVSRLEVAEWEREIEGAIKSSRLVGALQIGSRENSVMRYNSLPAADRFNGSHYIASADDIARLKDLVSDVNEACLDTHLNPPLHVETESNLLRRVRELFHDVAGIKTSSSARLAHVVPDSNDYYWRIGTSLVHLWETDFTNAISAKRHLVVPNFPTCEQSRRDFNNLPPLDRFPGSHCVVSAPDLEKIRKLAEDINRFTAAFPPQSMTDTARALNHAEVQRELILARRELAEVRARLERERARNAEAEKALHADLDSAEARLRVAAQLPQEMRVTYTKTQALVSQLQHVDALVKNLT